MPYVYVMEANNICKIGITSTSVNQRKKELQTGCPYPISKIWCSKNIPNALEIERVLHSYFKDKNTSGEWFDEKFATIVAKADSIIVHPSKLMHDNKKLAEQNKSLISENKQLKKEVKRLKELIGDGYNPNILYLSIWRASTFSGLSPKYIKDMIKHNYISTIIKDGEELIDYSELMRFQANQKVYGGFQ